MQFAAVECTKLALRGYRIERRLVAEEISTCAGSKGYDQWQAFITDIAMSLGYRVHVHMHGGPGEGYHLGEVGVDGGEDTCVGLSGGVATDIRPGSVAREAEADSSASHHLSG